MRGHRIIWTPEELAWVEAHASLPRRELLDEFRKAFVRPEIGKPTLASLCKRNGWFTGRSGRFVKGIVSANKGKTMPFNPNSARTRFARGHVPHNVKFEGHERVSKDGYVEISISETNPHTGFERRHVLKHLHLWQQANGPLPEGHCLKNLDGDRTNCDPSNWIAVPRALLPRLNGRFGRNYDGAPAAVKPLILAVARLEHKAREKRKS